MRESEIERTDRAAVESTGGRLMKFVSPGRRGVPDRLLLQPVPPEHRELVARYVRFIEYKAPKEKPSAAQIREHDSLRQLGLRVDVVDAIGQLN